MSPRSDDHAIRDWAMNLFARAANRLKRAWGEHLFDRKARRILHTRPLETRGDSPLFLTMVCHRDVTAYLLAIKSLYTGIGQGRAAIIDDGSLTKGDLATLRYHVSGIEVLDIAAITTGACPRGGTWERLVKILELSTQNYVIQIDADVLVCAAIPEVVDCWQQNRSFLLGTNAGRSVAPATATAKMVRGWIETQGWTALSVGVEAEAMLDTLPAAAQKSYVHASSGFAGFAAGAFATGELESFSRHMSDVLGEERWREWGTEQVASNYVLANAPGAAVLPFPRYACFEPHLPPGERALLHFIGTYRYNRGEYRRQSAKFIDRYQRL
jgi:hypothetical protein